MIRFILSLAAFFSLVSCECEPGPTGPHAFVENFIVGRDNDLPDATSLQHFRSSLRHLSFDELLELTDRIHEVPRDRFQKTGAAEVLAQEIWSRQPDLLEFHRILGGYGEDGEFNKQFLTLIAKTDPDGGWKLISAYYLALYQADNFISSMGAALPFFSGLQIHHPGLARQYFLPLAFEPKFETGALKSDALSGIFAGMTKQQETLSFIDWARREKIDQRLVGMFIPQDPGRFLKIHPSESDLSRIVSISLTILAKLSPSEAERWIIQNQKANSLPEAWARAYLHGLNRSGEKKIEAGLEFIARISKPKDRVLEKIFEESRYFYFAPATQERLLKIRTKANR